MNAELENGIWIPLEVEWISTDFEQHGHPQSPDFQKFLSGSGVLLVLRRNQEIARVQQVSIFESMAEGQFKKSSFY